MAYDPNRIVHFQIGAYTHQHVLAVSNAHAMTGLHVANALGEAKKSGQGMSYSPSYGKEMASHKKGTQAEDALKEATVPTGEVFGVPKRGTSKTLPSTSYKKGVGTITSRGKPVPGKIKQN